MPLLLALALRWRTFLPTTVLALMGLMSSTASQAVPSYARQTGMECGACHIGAFGPQLTPAGIRFKLGGYVDSDGKDGKVPLSGMLLAGFTHTDKDQDPPDHLKANNNLTLDQASLFIAGRASDHVGSFVQITYDGVARQLALDQTDIRFTAATAAGGQDLLLGITLNNNPTMQDPFNTLPAWSYPFTSPSAGFGTGDSASLINGGLSGIVFGGSAYAVLNQDWYAELGTYRSMAPTLQSHLGLGRDEQKLQGNAYWRFAWMKDLKSSAWSVGVFGWQARLEADRTAPDPADSVRDLGVDGSYQFLGTREHIVALYGSLTQERRRSGADQSISRLTEERLNATYHYQQTWGASTGLFSTHGSDPAATTRGMLVQADWTPWGKEAAAAPSGLEWLNLKVGAQFWHYASFDGTRSGARDHDTLGLFAWSTF